MRRHSLSIGIVAIAGGLLTGATTAQAAIETWVSGTGTDGGTCQISAPCRTFAFAHSQTNANGAINVLTSGNYGPVTITKAISIVAQGVEAIINSGAGGAGIIVQAGAAAIVSLRGLTIDLHGGTSDGIWFLSGAALHVHDSVIRKSTFGIRFKPNSGTGELYVADSVIADVSQIGIEVRPSGSAGAKATLDRVRVENASFNGIVFNGTDTTASLAGTVRDSVAAGNDGIGIYAIEGGAGTIEVMVVRSASVNNLTGIGAFGPDATVWIADTTVSGNGTGLNTTSSGVIVSYGTNKVNGNGTNGVPTSTFPPI
jgi:hypothetical protein